MDRGVVYRFDGGIDGDLHGCARTSTVIMITVSTKDLGGNLLCIACLGDNELLYVHDMIWRRDIFSHPTYQPLLLPESDVTPANSRST